MQVTHLDTIVHRRKPNPNPIRDALQSLPGAGTVQVIAHTDEGVSGSGTVGHRWADFSRRHRFESRSTI